MDDPKRPGLGESVVGALPNKPGFGESVDCAPPPNKPGLGESVEPPNNDLGASFG